jgi:SAM-dependent methyltransferase
MPPQPVQHQELQPSAWILRFLSTVAPGGSVLDVAAGGGRHTRLFAERGHPVVAVDRDTSALHELTGPAPAEIISADLESGAPWPLGKRHFAAVVVTNYLHRPLLPAIVDAVAPGGLLLYETFAAGNERFGKPSNPDFLLQPGELLETVRGKLRVLAYEHLEVAEPKPAMVQRIAAARAAML